MAAATLCMKAPVKFMFADEEGKWSVTPKARTILEKINSEITVIAIAGA